MKNDGSRTNEEWLSLEEVLPFYAQQWCGGAEHAKCNASKGLARRQCPSDKCWNAGLAIQGVIEGYEILERIAAPIGLITFTKVMDWDNGKIHYAFMPYELQRAFQSEELPPPSSKNGLVEFDNRISALQWLNAMKEAKELMRATENTENGPKRVASKTKRRWL